MHHHGPHDVGVEVGDHGERGEVVGDVGKQDERFRIPVLESIVDFISRDVVITLLDVDVESILNLIVYGIATYSCRVELQK